jgi:hypothetical protein
MGLVVFAFMALSLAVTATGTARFAVAMGYSPIVGYVVGAIFEFAKEVLPLAIRALRESTGAGHFNNPQHRLDLPCHL